jgi:dolichyl-phosphate-mannose--protein O-mannosyl transferase
MNISIQTDLLDLVRGYISSSDCRFSLSLQQKRSYYREIHLLHCYFGTALQIQVDCFVASSLYSIPDLFLMLLMVEIEHYWVTTSRLVSAMKIALFLEASGGYCADADDDAEMSYPHHHSSLQIGLPYILDL